MTLVEFLLARIEEDQINATMRTWHADGCDSLPDPAGYTYPCDCGVPERMTAECSAKRRIIEFHESWPVLVEMAPEFTQPDDNDDISGMTLRMSRQIAWLTTKEYIAKFGTEPPTTPILIALAAPYASHPDFDPSWRHAERGA